jgi:hypothetical protein
MLHGSTNKLKNVSFHLIFTSTPPETEFSSIFVQKPLANYLQSRNRDRLTILQILPLLFHLLFTFNTFI